ncbi:hypothetical protein NQ317_016876 [Molorchus minor]|uniref:RanBD1 domain-containing protein n=1 Tax=Molorchus minor TaxID=1323400 RepID=A0ABQ9J6Z8_9CUCU|nr:hypothetical protein NQ317_016876 [Molorchus minor]
MKKAIPFSAWLITPAYVYTHNRKHLYLPSEIDNDGKRSATSDLNHDNWDRDEEPEDAGTFQRASEHSLKQRIIKTARRRNPISSVRSDADAKSAFTSFTAFSKTPVPTSSAFSFLSNIKNQTGKSETNGTSLGNEKAVSEKKVTLSPTSPNFKESSDSIRLNESVATWIKKHVDTNPLINLQPIFRDYETYFTKLENEDSKLITETNKNDLKQKNENTLTSSFLPKMSQTVLQENQINLLEIPAQHFHLDQRQLPLLPLAILVLIIAPIHHQDHFRFGNSHMSTSTTTTPTFSFGSNISNSSTMSLKMSDTAPFTFGNVTQPLSVQESNKEKETEEEDEPPKVKFTPVVEKDYVFTVRCKVFVKKADGNYADRGVGNLYLKSVPDSNKVQLIVRADTNLGNLLCNFILSECIPTKRIGKKDVMLVCLPTPDFEPPPVPLLLRVKSPEEADKLLEVLEKHKK